MHHTIPLFPLSHGIFPDGMLPLQIFEVRYLDLIKRCNQQQLPFGVAWIKQGSEVQVPGQMPSLHEVGCMAHIREFEQVQPTFFRILCQGGLRAQDPEVEVPASMQAHADQLGKVIASAQQQGVIDKLPIFAPYHLDQCGWLANRYAEAVPMSAERKLQLFSELDPLQRLESVIRFMQKS
ncbi:MAG: LON peptidase substrate-binding domain-containing protein [Burkholderiales bacterium]|nr:LON peptidase substrate-binding domain-containing protein [Burkholderiales bacterium]